MMIAIESEGLFPSFLEYSILVVNFHDLYASNKINKDSILFDTNHKNIYNMCTYYKEEELWNLVLA